MVCKLKKALYGLKQAPRAWYARLYRYLLQQSFRKGKLQIAIIISNMKMVNCSLLLCILMIPYLEEMIVYVGSFQKRYKRNLRCLRWVNCNFFLVYKLIKKGHFYFSNQVYQRDVKKVLGGEF